MFIILTLIVIANYIIGTTILPGLSLFGYVPNISLIIVVVISLLKGKYYGSFLGLAIGLIQDIMFSFAIGVNGFIYFTLGFMIGTIEKNINNENIILPVIFSSLGTIYYNLMYFIFIFFLSRKMPNNGLVSMVFTLEILYNGIVSILIYILLSKIFVTPSLRFGKR